MAGKPRNIPPDAELRRSQVLTTYGPGALVDFPEDSVVMSGTNHWGDANRLEEIVEERLTTFLARDGADPPRLRMPPTKEGSGQSKHGIKAFPFPNWFVAQITRSAEFQGRSYRTRPLLRRWELVKSQYRDEEGKLHPVVPVRFVVACANGHLDDLDWPRFARVAGNADLWLDEGGAGNDFADIFVRTADGKSRRPLADANIEARKPLGDCQARRPWMGRDWTTAGSNGKWEKDSGGCDRPNKLLTRHASNAYFSQTVSVIHIPDGAAKLRDAVDGLFGKYLRNLAGIEQLKLIRSLMDEVRIALDGLDDADVWDEIDRRKTHRAPDPKPLKETELATFLAQPEGEETGTSEDRFFARRIPLPKLHPRLDGKLERIVLGHRLSEVVAQVGFTRFEPGTLDIDSALSLDVQLAPLGTDTSWYPAVENRGEGVFLGFAAKPLDEWARSPRVKDRSDAFARAFSVWAQRRGVSRNPPTMQQVMLHSLSHLLLTGISLECGYAASSIRERVYASRAGYGILLYTGAPGVEGTLGGLIEVGRTIDTYLLRALESAELCSNDPVCAKHGPSDQGEDWFLHGAACHGCLLIAETSCERGNELLDRALVVPTLLEPELAYFGNVP